MSAPSVKAPSGLLCLGTLPVAVAVLTLITADYYLLVAIGNITDFGTNQQFVSSTSSRWTPPSTTRT